FTGFGEDPCATLSARNASDLTVSFGSSSRSVLRPTIIASDSARRRSTRCLSGCDDIAAPLRANVSILPSAVIATLMKTKGRFILPLNCTSIMPKWIDFQCQNLLLENGFQTYTNRLPLVS